MFMQKRLLSALRIPQKTAFSLVEVTLALGIAAFALVAIFGLLPIGLKSNQTSLEQTAAAAIASGIVADLQATPVSIPPANTNSPRYQIKLNAPSGNEPAPDRTTIFLSKDGSPLGSIDANADAGLSPRFRATVYVTPPAASQRFASAVRILITWPALADPVAANEPAKFAGSFETLSLLDRN